MEKLFLIICFMFLFVLVSEATPTQSTNWGLSWDAPSVPVEGHYLYWRVSGDIYINANRYQISDGTLTTIMALDIVGLPANTDNMYFVLTAFGTNAQGNQVESGYSNEVQKPPFLVIEAPTGVTLLLIYNGPQFTATPGVN